MKQTIEELQQVLKKHKEKYPEMELTDIVKLIYQNEFGGGHLIPDEEASLQWIQQEYENCRLSSHEWESPLWESIGNGSYYVYGTNFTASSRLEINKELQETQYISPTQLLVQNVELADGDQVSVATQSNSSTKKVLSRTDYLTYNEDNGELMSQESYQAKKSAKAMIERLKEQHEKAQADEQADDGQTQEETTTEETTPELSLTPAPASTPES